MALPAGLRQGARPRRRPPVLRQPESSWSRQVTQAAELMGWTFQFHPHDSRHSETGWPDWTFLRPRDRRALFVELKADDGVLTTAQDSWITMLRWCGFDARVWRPRDWLEVQEALR